MQKYFTRYGNFVRVLLPWQVAEVGSSHPNTPVSGSLSWPKSFVSFGLIMVAAGPGYQAGRQDVTLSDRSTFSEGEEW